MATAWVEIESSVAERLAVLTARSKHITGEGYGTTRADPMMMAGAMAGLTELQRELMHAKYMLDYRAQKTLVGMYAQVVARQYCLEFPSAMAVSRAAVHCVVNGSVCRKCHGTGITSEQKDCPKCEGLGMKSVSDRERAKVAEVDKSTWLRRYAEIADNAETKLRISEMEALRVIKLGVFMDL